MRTPVRHQGVQPLAARLFCDQRAAPTVGSDLMHILVEIDVVALRR
ncbi:MULTISPECIES: hypothetical protein [unclassified Streptomyces]|nr:hypothetical protein [Streptomyces sp. SM10]